MHLTHGRAIRVYFGRMESTASPATLPDALCMSVVECSLPVGITLPMRRAARFAPARGSVIRFAIRKVFHV